MEPEQSRATLRQQRLLAEWICREEESAGHPGKAAEAERRAIEAGGSFRQRVLNRAAHMDTDGSRTALIRRALGIGRGVTLLVCGLAALAGIIASATALGRDEIISVPLVLLALVGVNLLSLILWILLQFAGRRRLGLISTVWSRVATRMFPGPSEIRHGLLQILTSGRAASWRVSLISHGAWLAYTAAGLVCLSALLSVRAYELDWQTTLLSRETLHAWALFLSAPHQLLGLPGPEVLDMNLPMGEGDRRGWARWLLVAVASFGLCPRLCAWLLCFWKVRRAEAAWARDESRPGIARLRARLMPQRGPSRVVDAQVTIPDQGPGAGRSDLKALPYMPAQKIAVDWPDASASPDQWTALVEDSASRRQAEERLRDTPPAGLIIVAPATATPDRGIERTCRALAIAAGTDTWLALADYDQLRARGEALARQRLQDWRALATRAAIDGGVGRWDARTKSIRAFGGETQGG